MITIVGEAGVVIRPVTDGFAEELDAQTAPALDQLGEDAGAAGTVAGQNLRSGVSEGASGLEDDMGDLGAVAGTSLRTGAKDAAAGLEGDLSDVGAASGLALRTGAKDAVSGLEGDLAGVGNLSGVALRDAAKDGASGLENDLGDIGNLAGVNLRGGVKDGAAGMEGDLSAAGKDSGEALRDSVKTGASGIANDLGDVGNLAGVNLRGGVKDGAAGIEGDLADVGSKGGTALRDSVDVAGSGVADDLEKVGDDAGSKFSGAFSGGLSKLANLISNTGLPLGAFSSGLEKSADAAKDADSSSSGLGGTLDKLGGVALVGVAAGFGAAAVAGVHLADTMQSADHSIAVAQTTSVAAATAIGNSFLDTAGQVEFSGEEQAKAFAAVAGQLEATQGHALDVAQANQVMAASMNLATATGTALGTTTSTVASVMQAFGEKASDAASISDVLFKASEATGQSVDTLGQQLDKTKTKLGAMAPPLGQMGGLLVDMTDHGETGRAAMTALTTTFTTMLKPAEDVVKAQQDLKIATDNLPPSLAALASSYENGTLTGTALTAATGSMSTSQVALWSAFTSSYGAAQTSNAAQQQLGITTTTSTGKFVGMASVITQLNTQIAGMTTAQATAKLAADGFGTSASKLLTIIQAGPSAYDAATASVTRMGAAHVAAAQQSDTLHVELSTLGAEVEDETTKFGQLLIPIITTFVGAITSATTFVLDHKTALIALGVVVGGVLTTAIAVFTVNKMSAFVSSFQSATTEVGKFISFLSGPFKSQLTSSGADADAAGAKIETIGASATTAATETDTAATNVTASTATMDGDFAGAGASATTMATDATAAGVTLDADVAADVVAVSAADTTIEADNVAAGLSFSAMLGPIALAAAALVAFHTQIQNAILDATNFLGITSTTTKTASGLTVNSSGQATGVNEGTWSSGISDATGAGGTGNRLAGAPTPAGTPGSATSAVTSSYVASSPTSTTAYDTQVLKDMGVAPTPAALADLAAWGQAENTKATYNPLAINNAVGAGSSTFNSAGVQNFGSASSGAAMEAKYIDTRTPTIQQALQSGVSPAQLSSVVTANQWGTEPFGGAGAVAPTGAVGATGASPAASGTGAAASTSTPVLSAPSQAQIVADAKAGDTALGTLVNATHAAALKTIGSSLDAAHVSALKTLDTELNADHVAALQNLVAKLDATHNTKLTALAQTLDADYKSALAAQKDLVDADTKQGTAELNTLVTAAHTTSLSKLNTMLDATHTSEMKTLVSELNATHNTQLEALATKIDTDYQAALAHQAALVHADTQAGLTEQNVLVGDATTTSLQTLNTTLNQTHVTAMDNLVNRLDATHDAALEKMASSIEQEYQTALANQSYVIEQDVAGAMSKLASSLSTLYSAGAAVGAGATGASAISAQEAPISGNLTGAALAPNLANVIQQLEAGNVSPATYAQWAGGFGASSELGADFTALAGGKGTAAQNASTLADVYSAIGTLSQLQSQGGFTAAAGGGLFNEPALALIGEAGPEVVIPVSQLGPKPGALPVGVNPGGPMLPAGAAAGPLHIGGDVNINVSEAQSTLAQMMGEAAWQWKTGALPTMMGAPPVPALA